MDLAEMKHWRQNPMICVSGYPLDVIDGLFAEVDRLVRVVTAMEEGCYVCQHPKRVDELTCQKNALQQVVREREEQITRLQSSLTLSREEGRREGMEEAAKMVDALKSLLENLAASSILAVADNAYSDAAYEAELTAAAIRSEAKGERK